MQLKVGDRIYRKSYGKVTGVYVIERLTKTTAVSNNGKKFRIDYSESGWVNDIGSERWASNSFYIETPELQIEYFRQLAYNKVKSSDLTKLTTEQLKAILDIIEPKTEKE